MQVCLLVEQRALYKYLSNLMEHFRAVILMSLNMDRYSKLHNKFQAIW